MGITSVYTNFFVVKLSFLVSVKNIFLKKFSLDLVDLFDWLFLTNTLHGIVLTAFSLIGGQPMF